ncbi:hypothetical protein WS62_06530 [Burkholderia sp. ABCPW 14]|nr:hypothetical protein WS62_06530 [Burkholderia sp. ABCPW 14]
MGAVINYAVKSGLVIARNRCRRMLRVYTLGELMADRAKKPPPREPADLDLLTMAVVKIPHMLENIAVARRALELEKQYGGLEDIEIYRAHSEGRLMHIRLGSYTQPITSMAAIQCRVVLEFLGLGTSKKEPYRLAARASRESGDIGIEDFANVRGEPLERMTPEEALKLVPNPVRAELAWVTTIHFANQRLAHATDDYRLGGRPVRPHLYNAFRTVPMLAQQAFEERRGSLVGRAVYSAPERR